MSRWGEIEELFSRVVDLADADRRALLAERRAVAPDIVAEVERLLVAEGMASVEFISRPLWSPDRGGSEDDIQAPVRMGAHEIVRLVGRGGMGAVYMARHEPTGRLVALKLLRPGVGSRRQLDRFRLEAETLARLSEPRIAQLYDSGVAPVEFADGVRTERPFIAMEYVAGGSIVEEASARRLNVLDRLRLMEGVARAVQHAHQRGVIHRDLKPSNILVAEDGTPKVVDFGIARLLGGNEEALTVTGQVLGTTRYMSPEQASGIGVDTRSDIYALGAVLYELLAERPIIDVESASSFSVMTEVLNARPPRLGALNPAFRGDIEAVVHKAIERGPEHRYQFAGDLADDLARILNNEAVEARTPTTIERMIRSAKRNKPLSAAIGVAVVAMIGGTCISVWQAGEARELAALAKEESSRANKATADAREQARRAGLRAEEATRQRDMLMGTRDAMWEGYAQVQAMLASAASSSNVVREGLLESMRRILEKAEQSPDGSVVRQASRYDGISQFYETLGEPQRALEWRIKTVELLETAGYPEDILLLTNRALVATLTFVTDRNADLPACESVIRECRQKLLRDVGENETIQIRLAQAHSQVLERLGRFDESEKNYRRLIEVLEEAGDNPDTLRHVTGLLGVLYRKTGRYGEALPLIQRVIEGLESEGAPEIDISRWIENRAFSYEQLGEYEKARESFTRQYDIENRAFGDQHVRTAQSGGKLARVLDRLGTHDDEAIRLFTRSMEVFRRSPTSQRDLCAVLNGLSRLYLRRGEPDTAEPYLNEALGMLKGASLESEFLLQAATLNQAALLRARSDAAGAEATLLKLHEALVRAGKPNTLLAETSQRLAELYEAQGKPDQAGRWRKSPE